MASSTTAMRGGTKSTCTMEVVEGFHQFEIQNYSKIKGSLPTGRYVTSGTFTVAGSDWSIVYYPNGNGHWSAPPGYASAFVLLASGATARATYTIRLVNPASELLSAHVNTATSALFSYTAMHGGSVSDVFCVDRANDRLVVECVLSIEKEPRVSRTTRLPEIKVPPSVGDLTAHLGGLLVGNELPDVTFDVQGEKFPAHRTELARGSPVFKAQLFGPMREGDDGRCITVQEMQPAVFEVLLYFIYKGSLPPMDDPDDDEGTHSSNELARHLLAAADRYGVGKLKELCESILSTGLNPQTVARTLAFADLYSCSQLKEACVRYVISLGMTNDAVAVAVASGEDDQRGQLNIFTLIKYLWREIRSIFKVD